MTLPTPNLLPTEDSSLTLRDRLAKALRGKYDSSDTRPSYRAADAVLPVVEAALTKQTQRAEQAEPCGDEHPLSGVRCTRPQGHDTHLARGDAWTRLADDTIDKWWGRAQRAERERDEARAAVAEARAALDRASAEMAAAKVRLDRSAATHMEHAKAVTDLSAERDEAIARIQRVLDLAATSALTQCGIAYVRVEDVVATLTQLEAS
jgi:hypothetical protein